MPLLKGTVNMRGIIEMAKLESRTTLKIFQNGRRISNCSESETRQSFGNDLRAAWARL